MGRVRPNRRYPKEFKIEVVRRLESGEISLSELCRELGLSQQYVSKWKLEFSKKGTRAFPGAGKKTKATDEAAELRKEIDRLKEENEILKKAAAYFAKELR
jgi:transposase